MQTESGGRPRRLDRPRPLGLRPRIRASAMVGQLVPTWAYLPRPATAPSSCRRDAEAFGDLDALHAADRLERAARPRDDRRCLVPVAVVTTRTASISLPERPQRRRTAVCRPDCRAAPRGADAAARRRAGSSASLASTRVRRSMAEVPVGMSARASSTLTDPERGSSAACAARYDRAASRYAEYIAPTFRPIALARPRRWLDPTPTTSMSTSPPAPAWYRPSPTNAG